LKARCRAAYAEIYQQTVADVTPGALQEVFFEVKAAFATSPTRESQHKEVIELGGSIGIEGEKRHGHMSLVWQGIVGIRRH